MHYCFLTKARQKKNVARTGAGKNGSGILQKMEYAKRLQLRIPRMKTSLVDKLSGPYLNSVRVMRITPP